MNVRMIIGGPKKLSFIALLWIVFFFIKRNKVLLMVHNISFDRTLEYNSEKNSCLNPMNLSLLRK